MEKDLKRYEEALLRLSLNGLRVAPFYTLALHNIRLKDDYNLMLHGLLNKVGLLGLPKLIEMDKNILDQFFNGGSKIMTELYKYFKVKSGEEEYLKLKRDPLQSMDTAMDSLYSIRTGKVNDILFYAKITGDKECLVDIERSLSVAMKDSRSNWYVSRYKEFYHTILAKLNPDSFYEEFSAIKQFKGLGVDERTGIVEGLILTGKLGVTGARRMRSEGSSAVSLHALRSLILNRHLYENIEELIIQFNDSRHESVISLLSLFYNSTEAIGLMGSKYAKENCNLQFIISDNNANDLEDLFADIDYNNWSNNDST